MLSRLSAGCSTLLTSTTTSSSSTIRPQPCCSSAIRQPQNAGGGNNSFSDRQRRRSPQVAAAAAGASWQNGDQQQPGPQQQQQQPQQPSGQRSRSKLLQQREALAWQQQQQQQMQQQPGPPQQQQQRPPSTRQAPMRQQQQQQQPWPPQADGNAPWYNEQNPLGSWGQQPPPAALAWRQQQQQQQQQQQWGVDEEQEVLQQMLEWLDQSGELEELPGPAAKAAWGPQLRLVSRQQRGGGGRGAAWFHEPRFLKPSALHAEIMARSGRGQLEVAALTHLVRTSSSPQEAALALSAVSAVRHVALTEGRVTPWPDSFLKAFIKMTTICDSHEVLVSAMQRPNELGFVFKHKSLNLALKHWGARLELHKLEQIMVVAPTAGLPPDHRMAYALVRACVNARQWDKLDEVLSWFAGQGVTRYKPATEKLLEQAAAERRAAAAAGQM